MSTTLKKAVNDRTGVFKTDRNRTGHKYNFKTGPDRTKTGPDTGWRIREFWMKFQILKLMNCLENMSNRLRSDPDLPGPDLPEPRFTGRINFPRYRKITVFHLDIPG
eukprot:sb/3477695/